jgi:hypothetical protein
MNMLRACERVVGRRIQDRRNVNQGNGAMTPLIVNEGEAMDRYLRLIDSLHFFWPNRVLRAGFLRQVGGLRA